MNYYIITSDDELYHHGILGMKWGVWNAETQARYNGGKGTKKNSEKQIKKDRYDERKSVRSMSDKELQDKINRLRNEKTYRELLEQDIHPGRAAAKQVLGSSARKVAGIVVTAAGLAAISLMATKFKTSAAQDANLCRQLASEAMTDSKRDMLMRQAQMYDERALGWGKFEQNIKLPKK